MAQRRRGRKAGAVTFSRGTNPAAARYGLDPVKGLTMDGARDLLKSVRAVEAGRATSGQAREVLCFARLSGQRRHIRLARRVLRRRTLYWAAGALPVLVLLVAMW